MKKTEVFLVGIIFSIMFIFLGFSQYYLNSNDVFLGNYLMAIGFIMAGGLSLIPCFIETRRIIKNPSVWGRIALFLSPLWVAYVLNMILLMGINLFDMYSNGYSMLDEIICSVFLVMSAWYWMTFIVIEAIVAIILVFNKPVIKGEE